MQSVLRASRRALPACLGAIALLGPLVGCRRTSDDETPCTELRRFTVEVGRQEFSIDAALRPVILNEQDVEIPRYRFQSGAMQPRYCREDLAAAGRITAITFDLTKSPQLLVLYPKLRHVGSIAYRSWPPPERPRTGEAILVAGLSVVENPKGFDAYTQGVAGVRRIDAAQCSGKLKQPPAYCTIYLGAPAGGRIQFSIATDRVPLMEWPGVASSARLFFTRLGA